MGGARRLSWKESLRAEVSLLITPGINLTTASVSIPAATSPPVRTKSPILIYFVMWSFLALSSITL